MPSQELRKLRCIAWYDRPVQQYDSARTWLWLAPRLEDLCNASRVSVGVRREAVDLNGDALARW